MDRAQESSLRGLFLSRRGTKGGSGDCDMTGCGKTLTSPWAGASFKAANSPCPSREMGRHSRAGPALREGLKEKPKGALS